MFDKNELQKLCADGTATRALHYLDNCREFTFTDLLGIRNCLKPLAGSFIPARIVFLRNYSIEQYLPVFESLCLMKRIRPEISLGGYRQIETEVLNEQGLVQSANPDFLVLLFSLEDFSPLLAHDFASADKSTVERESSKVIDAVASLIAKIRESFNATILFNNFIVPTNPAWGIFDAANENGQVRAVSRLNERLVDLALREKNVYAVDLNKCAASVGHRAFFDPRMQAVAKTPYSKDGFIALWKEYARYIRACASPRKKVAVLDCDNTLWGGIIGEDGIERIALGPEYPGSCYTAFQRFLSTLRKRGVLLAINSKNNEQDVLQVFQKHQSMVLREEDIAARRINWNDKPSNMAELAKELNLGLDSFVFIDDSDVECDLMARSLPEVIVLKMPREPSEIHRFIESIDWFESLRVTGEDLLRGEFYRREAERKIEAQKFSGIDDYLRSLELNVEFAPAVGAVVPRLAEMSSKTNQFNLTTRRYSEKQIEQFMNDPASAVYHMRVSDKFGDSGIVGLAIVTRRNDAAVIDTLLVSCRVLGRKVEDAFLTYIVKAMLKKNIRSLTGEYLPTTRNAMVKTFYPDHGFQNGDTGGTIFTLDLTTITPVYDEWVRVHETF